MKTTYELWLGKTLTIRYLGVWDEVNLILIRFRMFLGKSSKTKGYMVHSLSTKGVKETYNVVIDDLRPDLNREDKDDGIMIFDQENEILENLEDISTNWEN